MESPILSVGIGDFVVDWRDARDHIETLRRDDVDGVRGELRLDSVGTGYRSVLHPCEVRFTLAAGGGVKLFPGRHVGARVDGRVFATLTDADARVFACSPGVCLVGFDADVVWQAEFTAGLVVRFR